MATTRGDHEDSGGEATGVAELSYSDAGIELDAIIEEFESGVVDVDRLVEQLERATEIVDELDRRLRRTRMQVEELVPRLEAIGQAEVVEDGTVGAVDQVDEDDGERGGAAAPGLF